MPEEKSGLYILFGKISEKFAFCGISAQFENGEVSLLLNTLSISLN